MSKFRQLWNPHSHSHFSLDGASSVDDIVKRNKELGAKHVALTEHGNMNSLMELVKSCKDHGMVPTPGIELYLESPFKDILLTRFEKEIAEKVAQGKRTWPIEKLIKEAYVHVTVLFKDEWAYNYFCKLTPVMEERAVVRYGESKPVATWDELAGAAGHIVVGSSCPVGYIQKWVLPGRYELRPDLAEKAYCQLREMVGPENFFVEVLPHVMTHEWVKPERDKETKQIVKKGYFQPNECCADAPDGDRQKGPNQFVIKMAEQYGDRILISLDSHFALPKQKVIQTAKISNGQENWVFHESYHLLSTEEAAEKLKRSLGVDDATVEKWVDNSYSVAEQLSGFKVKTNKDRWVLDTSCGSEISQLKPLIDRHGRMDWSDKRMVDQIKYEIGIMRNNKKGLNLLPYFFTVEDVANFCRENDILMTVRGSAGGSLLLYVLGVSAVNPLKHDLSFARFITEGRIIANTMPDCDIDISATGREKVLEYLTTKYGDKFCQISVDSVLKLKSSIKDAERASRGSVSGFTEGLCKSLPQEPTNVSSYNHVFGHTDKHGHFTPGLVQTNDRLKAYAEQNPDVWEIVTEMLGINRQKGVHACGCIIADKPIQEYCPITYISDTKVTGFSPKSVELAGLIKFDFLGLNTLTDIQGALRSIKNRTGLDLDPWNLPYDEEVVRAFVEGKTETVFQFDTDTVRPYLMKIMKLEVQNDIHSVMECLAAVTSLCRPGCLDAPTSDGRTLAEVYVACANGEEIHYVNKDLEPILGGTFGVQLFQEQSMRIFKDLAGYSDEQAETVRRGIGKKDEAVLSSCLGDLKKGCLSRGWTEQQVDILMDQIMASARYSFNKSHATSYAYIAYACMYLKTKYKLDWWKSVLSNSDKKELATKFWKYVRPFVKMPNVSKISKDFEIEGDNIVAPISIITGIGEKAYAQLLDKAPYNNLNGFVQSHFTKGEERSAIHTGIAHKLVAAGVLDVLFTTDCDSVEKKIKAFEIIKAAVKGDRVQPVPEKYFNITAFGQYMLMKETIGVYSDDLRNIALPGRGELKNGIWYARVVDKYKSTGDHFVYKSVAAINGDQVLKLKGLSESGMGCGRQFACVAYIVDESTKSYRHKKTNTMKYMTKLTVDVNGLFYEEVLWPPYGKANAPTGFKGLPVLITYEFDQNRYNVLQINPLIRKEQLGTYNIL